MNKIFNALMIIGSIIWFSDFIRLVFFDHYPSKFSIATALLATSIALLDAVTRKREIREVQ